MRDAIARASAGGDRSTAGIPSDGGVRFSAHASHMMLPLARGGDGDGPCLIEPAVRCNHCGYCVSYGH